MLPGSHDSTPPPRQLQIIAAENAGTEGEKRDLLKQIVGNAIADRDFRSAIIAADAIAYSGDREDELLEIVEASWKAGELQAATAASLRINSPKKKRKKSTAAKPIVNARAETPGLLRPDRSAGVTENEL